MLFTIQAYTDDYLRNRGLIDTDGYSVKAANLYYYQRATSQSLGEFIAKFHKIKTVFYYNNSIKKRLDFEKILISRIEKRYANRSQQEAGTLGGLVFVPTAKSKRISIDSLLDNFKSAVEARAIDNFWISRKNNKLRKQPEKIAQGLLATSLKMTLNGKGIVVREVSSGIGFVDVAVILSSTLHLVEIKILTKGFLGVEQLEQYMKTEKRRKGNLVVLDAMSPEKKVEIPRTIHGQNGQIRVLVIDINPSPPSSLNIIRH